MTHADMLDLNPTLTPEEEANVEQALTHTRLHALASAFMDTRPDLRQGDLQTWLIGHNHALTPTERALGNEILNLCYEKGLM